MSFQLLFLIGVAIVAYALVSRRAEESVLTPAMAFITVGILMGPAGFDWITAPVDEGIIHGLAELTLATILFVDASRIEVRRLWREHTLPVRMLVVALPLCVVAGAGVALLLFEEFSWQQAALVGAILAPTDAALGRPVVSHEEVPVRVRQTLNVESGLNDGLAYPVVFLFMGVLAGGSGGLLDWESLGFFARQIGVGAAVGVGLGAGGGWLLEKLYRRDWAVAEFVRLAGFGLVLAALGLASLLGGNGFIAAFVAGLAFGRVTDAASEQVHRFGQTEGELLALLTFLGLGLVVIPDALDHMDWRVFVYAALSLTFIRMVPVAISLIGMRLRPWTIGFLGWFGPRGIASVVFLMLLFEHQGIEHRSLILCIGMATVLGSVFLHGATAAPLSERYSGMCTELEERGEAGAEHELVSEMPTRHRSG